uniref:Ig-like domain-containing protein n=1 Tax=Gopherus agassizii TaxID=38772 RepID=A0A452J258_9SAUR
MQICTRCKICVCVSRLPVVLPSGYCLNAATWHEFLKPTIWVSPSRVVALGRNVTIRCEGQDLGMEFVLCKAGHPNQQVQSVVPEGKMAEFPIASVGQEDGGSYTCYYRSITDQSHWSFPSNPVEIIVGEPSYPKPNISGIPRRGVSVGEAMAIWCRRQRQGVRFVLNKEGRHFPPVDSDGFGAVFPISNVSREDGGNYSCSYHSRSEPFAVSDPSDPMELVVRGEGPVASTGTRGSRSAHGRFWFVSLCRKRSHTETEQVGTWILPLLIDLPGSQGSWVLSPALGGVGGWGPGLLRDALGLLTLEGHDPRTAGVTPLTTHPGKQ